MKSSRQLSKIVNIFLHIIALVFTYFLLQGGSLIIESLPNRHTQTQLEDYLDKAQLDALDKSLDASNLEAETLSFNQQSVKTELKGLKDVLAIQQQNYKEMLASRYVTEDNQSNRQVEQIRQKIEQGRVAITEVTQKSNQLKQQLLQNQQTRNQIQQEIQDLKGEARKVLRQEQRSNTLKAFLIRLLFVLPLMAIAVFLFKRFRDSSYWPFVYGWGYFSLYAFFIELVPYFPSYGGYVRSIVGIVACFLVGRFLIHKLQDYLEKKREMEQRDEESRRSSLQNNERNLENSFEKIHKGICPSCDRKFVSPDNKYCVYCGLCIKRECQTCNTLQVSFNQFCFECGEPHREVQENEHSEEHAAEPNDGINSSPPTPSGV
ncbi:hypothetical protein [Pseudoteredinibacter isoporae]|uniref:hypothetical protein n=1 Tax=Pseudoteredinibacter isoporae TaxID=570281 RepID=UPI003103AB32